MVFVKRFAREPRFRVGAPQPHRINVPRDNIDVGPTINRLEIRRGIERVGEAISKHPRQPFITGGRLNSLNRFLHTMLLNFLFDSGTRTTGKLVWSANTSGTIAMLDAASAAVSMNCLRFIVQPSSFTLSTSLKEKQRGHNRIDGEPRI
jgi:hypothetical protein